MPAIRKAAENISNRRQIRTFRSPPVPGETRQSLQEMSLHLSAFIARDLFDEFALSEARLPIDLC